MVLLSAKANVIEQYLLIVLVIVLSSCSTKLPELKGIDTQAWMDDKNGCKKKRSSMIAALEREQEKLLALTELQIVTVLGKPDQHELYKRNQKFYYYYLTPSSTCEEKNNASPQRLVIRFNAMGLAKETFLETTTEGVQDIQTAIPVQ
jgi:hypothetical protein